MKVASLEIELLANIARLQKDMSSAVGTVGRSMGAIEKSVESAKRMLGSLGLGLGVGAIISQTIKLTDSYTKFTAQLKLATTSQREYAQAYSDVQRISKVAQADLGATGVLYARIANGTRELAIGQAKVAAITEATNLALKVSGATTEESASAMLQLSQAFASGVLRGEEFNAVNEAAPRLMKALADGMGVPVGALREMATQGKITSQVMAESLPKALADLREEAKSVQTIGGAFTLLKNQVLELVGTQAQASGFVSAMTSGIGLLANNLQLLAGVAGTVVVTKLAVWLANATVKTYEGVAADRAKVASQQALLASTVTLAQSRVAETAASLAQITAMQAELPLMRAGIATRLASANADIRAAESAIASATATGALSASLRLRRQAELSLATSTEARSSAAAKLMILDQQQVRLDAQIVAAKSARATAEKALAGATAAAAVGGRTMTSVLGLLGGPVGWITTLLGLGATAWAVWGNKATEIETGAARAVDASTREIIANLDTQIAKLKERNALAGAGLTGLAKSNAPEAQRIVELRSLMDQIQSGAGQYGSLPEVARMDLLQKVGSELGTLYGKTEQLRVETEKLDAAGKQTKLEEWMVKLASKTEKMNAELAKARTELGAAFTPELEKRIRAQYEEKNKGAAATAKEASAYASLTASIAAKIEENKLELAIDGEVAESQKLRIKLDADLAAGKLKLTDAHKIEIDAALKALAASEAQMSMSKMLAAADTQKLDLSASAVQSAYDEARQNELLAKTFGMNKSAIEAQTVARLRDALAQAQANKASVEELKALELLIDAHERNAAAMRGIEAKEATKKANDELVADWKKTVDDYGTVFRDGFALMLNKGEDKWKSFTKSLRTTFATTVADQIYKMFAQPFVVRMVASIMGVGVAGGASASGLDALGGAGGGSGISSAMSLINMGKSLYSAISSGFAGISASVAGGVQSGMNFFAGTGGFVGQGPMQMSGFASGAGAAAGIAAGAGIGIMGGGLISGQYSAMGSNPNNAVYVGTAIGAAVGSIIPVIGTALGAAVGGILGGVYNRTFGMGKKEYGDTSIIGNFNAGGFSGHNETPWSQKGGLFRSNKSGTAYGVLDGEFASELGSAFGLVKSGVAALAMSVGVSADSLAYYSEQIKLTLTGSAEENQKLIEDTLSSVGENMIRSIIPSIADYARESETVAQTLERLSGSLAAANNALGMIRKELLEVSLAGADAAAKLGDVFGGLDQMAQVTQAFYMAVYSEGERTTHSLEGMRVALQSVGVSMPRTVLELRDMALAMDLTTDAGRAAYATLLTIAPEFAAVAEATKRLAEEMGDALLESFTARGQLVAALDVTALKTQLLRDALVSTYVAAGNISTLFLDLSSGLITFGSSTAVLDGEMTGAQAASAILADQIAELQAGAAGATIDFAKLTAQLGDIDTNVFVATITKAFEAMAQRIGSLIGDIVSERIAVREAVREIIDPGAMTPEAIRRQIVGINTTLPGNSGVVAAGMKLSAADAVAEQKRRQEEAARNTYLPAQGAYESAQSAIGPLSAALNEIQGVYDDYQRQIAQPRKYSEGRAYVRDLQAQLPGIEARLNQARADLAAAQGASSGARMDEINALAAAYANAVTESASAQAAANAAALEAKKSQTSYADALQAFAIDASKSVGKLSTLREETMRYYQAQKQLADLMGTSAAGLRKTAADYRYGQLDAEDQLNKLQADYAKAYSMALSTDGDMLVGYADQMNSMLNPMLEKARDVFGSETEYNAFVATMLARAEAVAGRLDVLAPAAYEDESLALLGQIDATLAALEASSRTAEQLVVNAINAGRDATVDALRHIASALGGQSIPAFASGGSHMGGLRLVGEHGPELEVTGPSRIYNANQTRSMLSGGGSGNTERLETLVAQLIQKVETLEFTARATAVNTHKIAKQGDRNEVEGVKVWTDAGEPIDVKVTA